MPRAADPSYKAKNPLLPPRRHLVSRRRGGGIASSNGEGETPGLRERGTAARRKRRKYARRVRHSCATKSVVRFFAATKRYRKFFGSVTLFLCSSSQIRCAPKNYNLNCVTLLTSGKNVVQWEYDEKRGRHIFAGFSEMHYLDEANQEESYMKKKSALSICLALLVFLLFSFAGCDSLTEAIFGQQGQKDNRISSFELVEKYFLKYRDKVGELIEKYVGEYTLEDDNDYTPTDNYFVDYTYTYAIDDDFYMELELTYDTDGGSSNSFCFRIINLTKDIEILKDMCERYSALMSEVVNFCAYDIRIEEGLYLELYDEVYEK